MEDTNKKELVYKKRLVVPDWASKSDSKDRGLNDNTHITDDTFKVISLDDTVVSKSVSDLAQTLDEVKSQNIDLTKTSLDDFSFDDDLLEEILASGVDTVSFTDSSDNSEDTLDFLNKVKRESKIKNKTNLVVLEDGSVGNITQENEQNIFDLMVIMSKHRYGLNYDEEEARRRAEEEAARRRAEEEARRRAEEERRRAEEEAARRRQMSEEERRRAEEEARRRAEEERRRAEEEARRRAEEEARRRAEEEARRKAEEEANSLQSGDGNLEEVKFEEEPQVTEINSNASQLISDALNNTAISDEYLDDELEDDVFDDDESATYSLKELKRERIIPDDTIIGGGR